MPNYYRKKGYQQHNVTNTTDKTTSPQFIAWDGEGVTHNGNQAQSYVLFGASTGHRIQAKSLSTERCLDLLLDVERENPYGIHVGFSIGYDVNMICKDLPMRILKPLWEGKHVTYQDYRLEFKAGKWFSVSKALSPGARRTCCKLYDVFGFFQSSFVEAVRQYLGEDDPLFQRVVAGKKVRSSFRYDELADFVIPYWESELVLLVRVMESLRSDLENAGIPITSYHGPGAVATTVLKKYNIQLAKADTGEEVKSAARYAYAGGRFEQFKTGHYPDKVWEYDINSAYPSIIATLPDLAKGIWRHANRFEPGSFAVWRVDYTDRRSFMAQQKLPQPFFFRDNGGRISYPAEVKSWAWTPEAELSPASVLEGWVFDSDNSSKPFDFVPDMYDTRQRWKQEGNSAQRALKLALNSLYGKMAQRKGWHEGGTIPKWHQLEWAGYVTSAVRRKIWDAIALDPGAVIASETDAVFATKPLPLDVGPGLGNWEMTEFDSITYIQNGFYFAEQDGKVTERYRGFDRGSVSYRRVLDYLRLMDRRKAQRREVLPSLSGRTTRFIGLGLSLQTSAPWRSWQNEPRQITIGGGGKRTHLDLLCDQCARGEPLFGTLHECSISTAGGYSAPHPLPWEKSFQDGLDMLDTSV